ncbi:MAG: carboxypeptidase regulatory-like domain-containing protein, partial [Planctomycetes bacterium]|nr:carboxypeptidase regulatory-like domain-containing protein [Planctomycetota bacterium]
ARTAPTATTDAGGHARFAGLRPGAYEVALPGSLPQLRVELAAGRTTARLLLPEPVPFGGRVVDDAGLPVADAEILVSETSGRGDLGAVVARTDAGGWFHAEALVERARVFARHPDHGPSNSVRLQPDGDCELALEPAGRRVEVRVFDGDGGPVADAYVALAPRSHGTDMVLPQHGRTDRSGAIVFTDPGEREATVVASRSDLPPAIAELPTDTDALTLVLGAGGTVRGIAVDERGEPLADQPVAATLTHARSNEPAGPLLARTVRTRADGTFEFARLPVGPLKVWIGGHDPADSLHGFLNRYVVAGADVDVEPGATHELRLVARAPTALHGRLRDGDGHDLAGFWIVAVPTRGVAFHRLGRARSARTAADGSFALAGVDPTTTYCLGAFPPAAQIDQLDSFPTAIRYAAAGDAPTEFTLRTAWQPCGRLRCRVVAPPGQAVAGTVLELRHREFCFPTTRAVSVDGSCEFGPLPPGDYYLAVATSESGTLTLPVVMPDDGSDVDLDAVQLALPARVVVDLHRQGGGSVADLRVVGRLAIGDKYVTATTDASGRAVLPALPPGEAIVLVHGPGMQPIERRLTLTDGPQWLELEAEPAAAVALTFRYAPVDNPFLINGPLLVDVVRPGGDIVFSDNVGAATSPGVFELTTGLPAGDYTVRATSLWNASAAIELHVERDRPVAAEATLRL